MDRSKTLVVYHYFEKDESYASNLRYFLQQATLPSLNFVFVVSGHCSVEIPEQGNLKIVRVENSGSDFAAYSSALGVLLEGRFDHYVFINCTMMGPFRSPGQDRDWTKPLTGLLTGDVKLVGATINVLDVATDEALAYVRRFGPKPALPHVQSMLFATDATGLSFLIGQGMFSDAPMSKFDVVVEREIRMSQLMLENGWNLTCLMPEYQGIDYRSVSRDINPSSVSGDPWFVDAYFGRTIHPLETIFFKTNRGMRSVAELRSLIGSQLAMNGSHQHAIHGAPGRVGPPRHGHAADEVAAAACALVGRWSDHADRHCIYVVSPKGYDHHRAFDEVALGLSAAFAERGGSAPVVRHPSEWAGRLPIVLGAHLLSPAMALALPDGSVIFNLEQVDRASGWLSDAYLGLMRRHAVLDYSHRNIAALRSAGIGHARLLPLGHADALERIAPASAGTASKDIDVLFYGSLNERRSAVLDALRKRGATVVHLFNVYGTERDAAIARSKVVLNLHHYEAAIFESARVGYLLANGACVVTEGVEGDPDLAPYRGGLAICGYGELVDICMLLLGEDAVRAELGERGRALMRAHRQADRLGDLFAPEPIAA